MASFVDIMSRVCREDGPLAAAHIIAQDAMRATAMHSHQCGQLLGTTTSVVTLTTAHGHWVVPPANAVWVPPGFSHALQSHGAFSGWSLYVAERACGALPEAPCALKASGLLLEAIARAATWTGAPESRAQLALLDVVFEEIRSLPRDESLLPMPQEFRVARVAEAMLRNPGNNRPLDAWADVAGVAARTLTRRFLSETGMSFAEWRQRARLLKAVELLAAGKPVTTVALDVGYSNVGAFIDMFKKAMGVTPGRFLQGTDGV
jgi:AraC-like DNA-binding protein